MLNETNKRQRYIKVPSYLTAGYHLVTEENYVKAFESKGTKFDPALCGSSDWLLRLSIEHIDNEFVYDTKTITTIEGTCINCISKVPFSRD